MLKLYLKFKLSSAILILTDQFILYFLARATEGTSLYVWVRQLVSQLVS